MVGVDLYFAVGDFLAVTLGSCVLIGRVVFQLSLLRIFKCFVLPSAIATLCFSIAVN